MTSADIKWRHCDSRHHPHFRHHSLGILRVQTSAFAGVVMDDHVGVREGWTYAREADAERWEVRVGLHMDIFYGVTEAKFLQG